MTSSGDATEAMRLVLAQLWSGAFPKSETHLTLAAKVIRKITLSSLPQHALARRGVQIVMPALRMHRGILVAPLELMAKQI